MGFIDGIKARAKEDMKTIVLPESYDMRVIEAASKIEKEKLAKVILIGDPEDIAKSAAGYDLTGVEIVNPETYGKLDDFIVQFYELRKRKGMTLNDARRILTSNFLFFGCMMVKMGLADGMVGGCTTPTANLLRPSLQILKTAPDSKLVSAFFVLDVPNCEFGADGVFIFSDAGLNQNPTSEELAHIAYDSAKTFETLVGKKPITAMLSHSTMGSASHPDVDKVRRGVEFAHEFYPDLLVDGELCSSFRVEWRKTSCYLICVHELFALPYLRQHCQRSRCFPGSITARNYIQCLLHDFAKVHRFMLQNYDIFSIPPNFRLKNLRIW